MINSTNTINIDGTVLKDEEFIRVFTFNKDDKFSQWVVRPIAVLAALGIGIAMFFASAFLIVMSLAMIPLLAIAIWVFKTKVERDLAKIDATLDTHGVAADEPVSDVQTAS